jgi:hypothetical protein
MILSTFPRRATRWLADAYFGPVPIAAGLLIAVAAVAYVWSAVHGHTAYPDVVVGRLTYTDGDKGADGRGMAALAVVTAAFAVTIGRVFRCVAPDGPASPVGAALNQLLLLSLAPAVWRLTLAAMTPIDVLPPIRLLAALPLGVLTLTIGLARYRPETIRPAHVLACGGAALLSCVFAGMAAAAVMVTVGRLGRTLRVAVFVSHAVGPTMVVAVVVAAMVVAAVWAASADVDRFRDRTLRVMVVAQLPLPLLLFHLVPPALVDPSHQFATPYPLLLVIVLGTCIAGGVWTLVRRLRQSTPGDTLRWAVAPVTVVALMVYCACPAAGGPPTPFRDFFHWGEAVLPWQQLWGQGRRPYVDFVPIHGLMDYLRGGMNQLFFGGRAETYLDSEDLLDGLAAISAGLAGCWLLGPVPALVLVAVPLPGLDRLFLLPPALYLAAAPATWRRPGRGLVAWLGLCVVSTAYNGAMGPAFVVGTAPIALWHAARAGWRRCGLIVAGLAVIVAVGAAISPVRQMAVAFVHFVADNGWTNTTANDIPWAEGAWRRAEHAGTGSTQLLWELERMSWIAVAVLAAGLAWRAMAKRASDAGDRPPAGLVAQGQGTAVGVALANPWTMGRIDPSYMSRPGAISQTAVCYLLPAMLLLAAPTARTVTVLALLIGLSFTVGQSPLDPYRIMAQTYSVKQVPAGSVMVDGNKIGLPELGQVVRPSPDWLADVVQLHRDLGHLLRPGETYLDLTDEQALYYYLDLPVPVRYTAYVAANSRLQADEAKQLAEHPVPAVMIGPATKLDGIPPSLRCYRLYKDYVTRFVPVTAGPFTFLVDPARAASLVGTLPIAGPGSFAFVLPQTDPTGERRLQILDDLLRPDDLHRVPLAWGRSWPALRPRFTVVGSATVDQAGPAHLWADAAVPPAVTDGAAADFLHLRLTIVPTDAGAFRAAARADPGTSRSAEPELLVSWSDGGDQWSPGPVRFKAASGDLLVPLGSYPRWLLDHHPAVVRITVANPSAVRTWHVDAATFLRLDPP